MDEKVAKVYGNKVRVRACGLCWEGDKLLMVNHKGITPTNFWSPPGGGVEFGMSVHDTLRNEFKEETGLIVTPGQFYFGCEYIEGPIHSVELFYHVEPIDGKLRTGFDPEIQIIKDVRFLDEQEIMHMPQEQRHGIFKHVSSLKALEYLRGFYRV